jgi:hypothetical protein
LLGDGAGGGGEGDEVEALEFVRSVASLRVHRLARPHDRCHGQNVRGVGDFGKKRR